MNSNNENAVDLVQRISKTNLYKKVVLQLQKDFEMCGLTIDLDEFVLPDNFVKIVHQEILKLLQHNFDAYLQLLYRVDLPEEMMNFNIQDMDSIAQKATFYILQREWQKVKLRASYG